MTLFAKLLLTAFAVFLFFFLFPDMRFWERQPQVAVNINGGQVDIRVGGLTEPTRVTAPADRVLVPAKVVETPVVVEKPVVVETPAVQGIVTPAAGVGLDTGARQPFLEPGVVEGTALPSSE